MEDRCIVCGELIPEGRQVCPRCEMERKKHDPVVVDTGVPDRRHGYWGNPDSNDDGG